MDQKELDQMYHEAMLTLSGSREWEMMAEELTKEIYQLQATLLESAASWDQVVFTRGWCKALAYVLSLRARTEAALEAAEDDDAHL